MKKRNYKRIYRPGTLFRVQGSDCVFMSLGLNPRNNRQIFSFNGIDIVERKTVNRADGRARPANKWEQATYWAVMKEVVDKRDRYTESVWHSKKDKPDDHETIVISDGTGIMACERFDHEIYRREDKRRYFYTDGDKHLTLDVSMSSRSDLLLLSDLLRREVKIDGVAEHLGYLEGELNGRNGREQFHYFEGDIYMLYADPTDRIFYDWTRAKDAGVYVATAKGWRKLLYTPTRGYVERDGELSFVDDKHFYSDYMLEASGKGWLYVGNIHNDMSVLVENQEE